LPPGLVGCRSALPAAIAPMSYQRAVHAEGEIGMARAAKEAGIPLTLSMMSSCPVEAVAAVGATLWQQLYWLRDRGPVTEMIRRAEEAGCAALVLTVDLPRIGRRLRGRRFCPEPAHQRGAGPRRGSHGPVKEDR